MRIKGKIALISGAGRNSGKAIALTFAREGADLILVAKEPGDEVKQVAKECEALGVQALAVPADVGRPEEVERVVKAGMERFGRVDVLVCVAAIRPHKKFWEYSDDEWNRVFAVNLHSTFYFARALAPGMIARRSGSIVVLGSVSGLIPNLNSAAETAAKHGLHGLVKSLALELGPYGVRANVVALASIETTRRNPEWYSDTGGDPNTRALVDKTALRRFGKPQEVADVVLFLASEESSYVTGDRILCMGGMYM